MARKPVSVTVHFAWVTGARPGSIRSNPKGWRGPAFRAYRRSGARLGGGGKGNPGFSRRPPKPAELPGEAGKTMDMDVPPIACPAVVGFPGVPGGRLPAV